MTDPDLDPTAAAPEWGEVLPRMTGDVDPTRLDLVTRRIRSATLDDLSPRRQNLKELADAVRDLIGELVATDAPDDVVAAAAADVRDVAARFKGFARSSQYGFSEAANAGRSAAPLFDQSPLIGLANPLAPPMTLRQVDDMIVAEVNFGQAYEGPPSCVHGGYVAAAFDELLGAAQSLSGAPGMTGTLSVRYETPTPLHTNLRFEARLTGVERRKIFVEGECLADGRVTARATGIFISMQPGRFMNLLAEREARADEHR